MIEIEVLETVPIERIIATWLKFIKRSNNGAFDVRVIRFTVEDDVCSNVLVKVVFVLKLASCIVPIVEFVGPMLLRGRGNPSVSTAKFNVIPIPSSGIKIKSFSKKPSVTP
jgi:hypothetical protein